MATTAEAVTQDEQGNRFAFSAKSLAKIQLVPSGPQKTYYDTNFKGLALRVGAKTKTFILYKRVKGGAPVRITLGQYGPISLEDAKKYAMEQSVVLNAGVNPLAEQKKIVAEKDETVRTVFDYYFNERINKKDDNKQGKKGTIKGINIMYKYFDERTVMTLKFENGAWVKDKEVTLPSILDRPFREITSKEVAQRFSVFEVACPSAIPKNKPLEPLKRTHQLSFKYANSAFTYYLGVKGLDTNETFRNPFVVLTVTKRWKKTNVKKSFINFKEELALKWWNEVQLYKKGNFVFSDYIMFSLLQAGRSIEIAGLTWDCVNFSKQEITYKKTKNGLDYTFPLTTMAHKILKRRKEVNVGDKYIFEYEKSQTGHVPQDSKSEFTKITTASGLKITHHDLRRTWATQARRCGLDDRAIDYCLKHKRSDVGEHYFMDSRNEIIEGLQMVEDKFLEQISTLATSLNETEQLEAA